MVRGSGISQKWNRAVLKEEVSEWKEDCGLKNVRQKITICAIDNYLDGDVEKSLFMSLINVCFV